MSIYGNNYLAKRIDAAATKARRKLTEQGFSDADIDSAAQGRMDAIPIANDDDSPTLAYLLVSVLMACRDAKKRLTRGDVEGAKDQFSGQEDRLSMIAMRPYAESGRGSKEGGGKGGKNDKRRKWAVWAAQYATCWEELPEQSQPWEFQPDEMTILKVYRDGDHLVAVDDLTDKESTLARSTVEKRYLK